MKTLPYLFKKPLKSLSLFLFFLPLLVSCNKEKLTKPTQTGANTFSCKINGRVYVDRTDLFSPALNGGFYTSHVSNSGQFSLSANVRNTKDKSEYKITIDIPQINTIGVYVLDKSNYCGVYPLPITINGKTYLTSNSGSGQVNITYADYNNNILSGTFSFVAVSITNANDRVTISDGRFDIQTK